MNPSNPVLFQHPINMQSLHPSLRNQTLTLETQPVSSNLKPVDIFQNFGTNRRETTNVLFNITKNPSHLTKCISSFQINRNRTIAKISSDILTNIDNKNDTILALLDLSSAFDTIDHTILIHRITYIGITGTVHKWITYS